MPKHDAIDYPIDEIRQRIANGETQAAIAAHLAQTLDPRVTPKLIYKVCKKHGIKCQRTGPRSGPGHPDWKGGRIVNAGGYVEIYCPDHPNKRKHGPYVLEHRLVMENALGRFLDRTEVVHHINGNTRDNRIENLELFSSNSEHLGKTLKGQRPKWTKAGRAQTLAAARAKNQRATRLRSAIQKALGLDELPSKYKSYRLLKRLGITSAEAYEMVEKQQPLPSFLPPHPKRKRGKNGQFLKSDG